MNEDPQQWEMNHTRKLLQYLMSSACASLNGPFLDEVDVEGLQLHDYHDIIKEPMWLEKMLQKLNEGIYQSIGDLICDFRLMLLNCYRYNGVDSAIGKLAAKFETIFEQKLQTLPHDLRSKTSIQMTLGGGESEESVIETVAGLSRRRSSTSLASRVLQTMPASNPIRSLAEEMEIHAQSTANGVSDEFLEDRCSQLVDQLRSWERKRHEMNLLESWDSWWSEQCSPEDEFVLKHSHELCQVYQYLCLAEPVLGTTQLLHQSVENALRSRAKSITALPVASNASGPVADIVMATPFTVTLTELEVALVAAPQASSLLSAIVQTLLSRGQDRNAWTSSNSNPHLQSYAAWSEDLKKRVSYWYSLWRERCKENLAQVEQKLKLDASFFEVMGFDNPLENNEFHQLSLYQRIILLKALVDHSLYIQDAVRMYMDRLDDWADVYHREHVLGEFDGQVYVHFPCFLSDSFFRVYRFPVAEWPNMDEAVGAVEDDAFYEQCSRMPVSESSRTPVWFDELVQQAMAARTATQSPPKAKKRSRRSSKYSKASPQKKVSLAELFDVTRVHQQLGLLDSNGQIVKRKQQRGPYKKKRKAKVKSKSAQVVPSSAASSVTDGNPTQEGDPAFLLDDNSNLSVATKEEEENSSQMVCENTGSVESKSTEDGAGSQPTKDTDEDSSKPVSQNVPDTAVEVSPAEVDSEVKKETLDTTLQNEVGAEVKDEPTVPEKEENGVLPNGDAPQSPSPQIASVVTVKDESQSQQGGESRLAEVHPRKHLLLKPDPEKFECVARDLSELNLLISGLRTHLSTEISNSPQTPRTRGKVPKVSARVRDLRELIGKLSELQSQAEEREPSRVECVRMLRLKIRHECEVLRKAKEKEAAEKARAEREARQREAMNRLSMAVPQSAYVSESNSAMGSDEEEDDDDEEFTDDEMYDPRDSLSKGYSNGRSSTQTKKPPGTAESRGDRLKQREDRKRKAAAVAWRTALPSVAIPPRTAGPPVTVVTAAPVVTTSSSSSSFVASRVFGNNNNSHYTDAGGRPVALVRPQSVRGPPPGYSFVAGSIPPRPAQVAQVAQVAFPTRPLTLRVSVPRPRTAAPLVRPKIFRIHGRHYLETGEPVVIHVESEQLEYLHDDAVPQEELQYARTQIQQHLSRTRNEAR